MGGLPALVPVASIAGRGLSELSRPLAASSATGAVAAMLGIALLGIVLIAAVRYRRRLEGGPAGEFEPAPPTAPEPEAAPDTAEAEDTAVADADRVDALLRDNDGRMHQSVIVEETGWSKSKVSMVLSEMEADGDITKLRIGRENIISLAGHEPDAVGSPHDE